jgi:hypothetical protein
MALEKASPLFGDITVYPADAGQQRVEIYLRLQQQVEGMQIGIAIDGSASMMESFAANIPKAFRQPGANGMEPVVKSLCKYACGFSSDGTVLPIYWATGAGGKDIESIGRLDADQSDKVSIEGPKAWGTGTLLLPPLEFFLAEYAASPWTVLLFITDGVVGDLDAVVARTLSVTQEINEGKRGKCKFIIVGYGPEIDESQIEQLDNLESSLDLWDGKLASEMNALQEIWDEVDFGISIPGNVRILDNQGREVVSYLDRIPQRMEFKVPAGTSSVTVEIAGQTIVQQLQ